MAALEFPIPKRAIKLEGGGYGPPPMFTEEEELEHLKIQEDMLSAATLKYLNDNMKPQGETQYVNMTTLDTNFRTTLGTMYHANFLVKLSDDPNVNRLIFVACKNVDDLHVDDVDVVDCVDFGPVEVVDDPERSQFSCQLCDKYEEGSPIIHPPELKMDHSCALSDLFEPTWPMFHPPNYDIRHLLFPQDLPILLGKGIAKLSP